MMLMVNISLVPGSDGHVMLIQSLLASMGRVLSMFRACMNDRHESSVFGRIYVSAPRVQQRSK